MKTNTQSDQVRWLAFIGIVGAITFGGYFVLYPQTLFKPGEKLFDLGYNLGLAGGLMMLTLLLYPLRKRIKFTSKMGALPTWFRWHRCWGFWARSPSFFIPPIMCTSLAYILLAPRMQQ